MTTTGWYSAERYGRQYAVWDNHYLRGKHVSTHPTQADAQAAADQLNTPRPTRQNSQQTSLFDTQEGS